MTERYLTTGQFEKLGHGFRQHCGPTAMTNLVLTLRAGSGAGRSDQGIAPYAGERPAVSVGSGKGPPAPESPEALFLRLARLGERRLNYVNLKLPFSLGGTSDLLCRGYLRAALRSAGLPKAEVGPRRPATMERLRDALCRGSLVYLQLRRHPRYGNHHLLCYGENPDGSLRVADGWTDKPVRLLPTELGLAWMLEISTGNKE